MKDTTAIETISCSYLKIFLSQNKYLTPQILEGEKGKSWDGYVEFNSIGDNTKKNIRTVPVQVKGSYQEDLSKDEISFQVEIADLENYYNDGGAIFFVVYINYDGGYKIYYKSLLPFTIRKIINQYKQKRTKNISAKVPKTSIKFKVMDDNYQEADFIFVKFLSDKDKQHSTKHIAPITKTDFENIRKNFSHFEMAVDFKKDKYNKLSLSNSPFFVYGVSKGTNIPIAVDELTKPLISLGKHNVDVCIDDIKFFDNYSYKISQDGSSVVFGNDNFIWNNFYEGLNATFTYNIDGSIDDCLNTVDFLIALKNGYKITAGKDIETTYDKHSVNLDNINLSEKRKELETIKSAIAYLGIKGSFILSDFTSSNLNQIIETHNNIVNQKETSLEFGEEAKNLNGLLGIITISKLKIILYAQKCDSGKYLLENPFAPNFSKDCSVSIDDSEHKKASIFVLLRQEMFEKCSNLDCQIIAENILSVPFSSEYEYFLIPLILDMLRAYDNIKKSDLLNSCSTISRYIKENNPSSRNILNYYQCVKRTRKLTSKEKDKLMRLRTDESDSAVLLAIAILLENRGDMGVYYKSLDVEQKDFFDSLPIRTLMD